MRNLVIIIISLLLLGITAQFLPPPGGVYSSCCNFPGSICNYIPVDSNFAPGTCTSYASFTGISCEVREYFMQQALNFAIEQEGSSCPFNVFSSVIVNHTGPSIADGIILCSGLNEFTTISPFWHGEIAAIVNCSAIFNALYGEVSSPLLWNGISLYTTAVSCPQCYSSQRWNKVGESVSGVTISELQNTGWYQILQEPAVIQQESNQCVFGNGTTSFQTRIINNVLESYLYPYFAWQFNADAPCPGGCTRSDGFCVPAGKRGNYAYIEKLRGYAKIARKMMRAH